MILAIFIEKLILSAVIAALELAEKDILSSRLIILLSRQLFLLMLLL